MTASDRMSSERAEVIIEEIATTLRSFANDERGLEVVHMQLIRPGDGKRLYVSYYRDTDLFTEHLKAGT